MKGIRHAHARCDRIGLVVNDQRGNDYYKTLILTDIDLLFGEKAKGRIVRIVMEEFEIYNRRNR